MYGIREQKIKLVYNMLIIYSTESGIFHILTKLSTIIYFISIQNKWTGRRTCQVSNAVGNTLIKVYIIKKKKTIK